MKVKESQSQRHQNETYIIFLNYKKRQSTQYKNIENYKNAKEMSRCYQT